MSWSRKPRTVRKHFTPNRPVVDGIRFDSDGEAARYGTLKLMMQAGHIRSLSVHPRLPMAINGRKIGRGYITLDFRYEEWRDGAWRLVYEDFKSVDTRESKVRRQVAEALHDIKIRVTS